MWLLIKLSYLSTYNVPSVQDRTSFEWNEPVQSWYLCPVWGMMARFRPWKVGKWILHHIQWTRVKERTQSCPFDDKKTSISLLKWQPLSSRILTPRSASQHAKLSVVVYYAPTNKANVDLKEEFYRTLQSVASDIPRHSIACFVIDFNAKIRDDHKYYSQSMGWHGLGDWNKNGEL
jgi:hypothetical protein